MDFLRLFPTGIATFVFLLSCKRPPLETSVPLKNISNIKTEVPQKVADFFSALRAHKSTPYVSGGTSRSGADCSGAIVLALKTALLVPQNYTYHGDMDYDKTHFSACSRQLYPGDILLLNRPGERPNHWIVVADVVDDKKAESLGGWNLRKNSGNDVHHWSNYVTRIMDQSTDDNGGFFEGPMLPTRDNIARREITACIRHKTFSKGYKILAAEQQAEGIATEPSLPASPRAQLVLVGGHYQTKTPNNQNKNADSECIFSEGSGRCVYKFKSQNDVATFVVTDLPQNQDASPLMIDVDINYSSGVTDKKTVKQFSNSDAIKVQFPAHSGRFTVRVYSSSKQLTWFNYEIIAE